MTIHKKVFLSVCCTAVLIAAIAPFVTPRTVYNDVFDYQIKKERQAHHMLSLIMSAQQLEKKGDYACAAWKYRYVYEHSDNAYARNAFIRLTNTKGIVVDSTSCNQGQ